MVCCKDTATTAIYAYLQLLPYPTLFRSVYRGILVEVHLQLCAMSNAPSLEAIRDTLAFAYEGSKQIHVADKASCEALCRMEIEQVGATDRLDIFVFGNERTGQARLDRKRVV